MPPSDDDTPLSREVELDCLQMESNWQLWQENVLPLETAWNEGRFYGLVLKGSRRFTGLQRVGIFVMGLEAIVFGSSMLLLEWLVQRIEPSLNFVHHRFSDLDPYRTTVLILFVVLGIRFSWVAVRGASADPPETRSDPPDEVADS
jgi:hypothetical protein